MAELLGLLETPTGLKWLLVVFSVRLFSSRSLEPAYYSAYLGDRGLGEGVETEFKEVSLATY